MGFELRRGVEHRAARDGLTSVGRLPTYGSRFHFGGGKPLRNAAFYDGQRSPGSFKRPIEADSWRSEYPASSTRHRSTTTPGAAGPCARTIGSTRSAARSSIRGPTRSSARSTTTASISRCATTGPSAERRANGRTASTRSRAGRVFRATPARRPRLRTDRPLRLRPHRPDRPGRRDGRAGQHIGWTCKGDWHVHLTEFLFTSRAHRSSSTRCARGGKLHPYVDTRAARDPRDPLLHARDPGVDAAPDDERRALSAGRDPART